MIAKFDLTNDHIDMPPLEEIGYYQPKPTPEAPEELVRFRLLSRAGKSSQAKDVFSQGFIDEYLVGKWDNERYNRDSFIRLWELFNANPELSKQIGAKLSQFKSFIMKQCDIFIVFKIDFEEYPFETDWDV